MSQAYALLPRTHLFEQQYILTVDAETDSGWRTQLETESIDDQVAAWVQATGNCIVGISPPGYHMAWLDTEMSTKLIIVGISVIYRAALEETDVAGHARATNTIVYGTSVTGADVAIPAEPAPAFRFTGDVRGGDGRGGIAEAAP